MTTRPEDQPIAVTTEEAATAGPASEQPTCRYVMVAARDNVLIKLFQTRRRSTYAM